MGVYFYPIFDRDITGYKATDVNGRALAYAVHNWLVPELMELQYFFSIDPNEVAVLAGYYLPGDEENNEDSDESLLTPAPPNFLPPPETWFDADEGLNIIAKALLVLRAFPPNALVGPDTQSNWLELTIEDLEDTEKALHLAKAQGAHFHFAMDF